MERSEIWRGLWKLNIPNAWKNLLWHAYHLLPTRDNLVWRKVILDPSYLICGLEAETTYHIFWGCLSARDVWGASARVFKKGEGNDVEIFVETARWIWFRRNAWIHEGRFTHPNEIVRGAICVVHDFLKLNLVQPENPITIGRVVQSKLWCCPWCEKWTYGSGYTGKRPH